MAWLSIGSVQGHNWCNRDEPTNWNFMGDRGVRLVTYPTLPNPTPLLDTTRNYGLWPTRLSPALPPYWPRQGSTAIDLPYSTQPYPLTGYHKDVRLVTYPTPHSPTPLLIMTKTYSWWPTRLPASLTLMLATPRTYGWWPTRLPPAPLSCYPDLALGDIFFFFS